MRFEEAYDGWQSRRLTQEEAGRLLGVGERTFRRYVDRYEEQGLEGLRDKRLTQVSPRKAPGAEVQDVAQRYRDRHTGWNVKHFYTWYQHEPGWRSYTWVKTTLQEAGLVKRGKGKGAHRKKRERSALPGMMVHQDASTHAWVPGVHWDLIVTMDDATSEHYSMVFVEEEGTHSSFLGIQQTLEAQGLFCSLYTDRGAHYWHTSQAEGKVDKKNLTQFGRAMQQLGIEMIAAYSPQARGRSERAFATHQGRLPQELALAGITDMARANRYLEEVYRPKHNAQFACPAAEDGSAFVPLLGVGLDEILCEHYERTVGKDNCVRFERLVLQIPADQHRCHYVKATVRVHRYLDGTLALFHGPRRLARYDALGKPTDGPEVKAAA
ncbi:MAG: ISNCY family transposase [Deferrisomatales bacterium]|nr:ISNCY family transposase [Deferrisomatales bacterium]